MANESMQVDSLAVDEEVSNTDEITIVAADDEDLRELAPDQARLRSISICSQNVTDD
jgi:hypothetical protein